MKNKSYKYFILIIGTILILIGIGCLVAVNTSFWGSADPVGTWWHRQAEKPDIVSFDVAFEYITDTETSGNPASETEKYAVAVNKKEQTVFIKQIESENSEISSYLISIKDKDKLKIEIALASGETETFEKSCDTDCEVTPKS